MHGTSIVIPCFNEAERLPRDQFRAFALSHSDIHFVFVNDGSTDDTLLMLKELVQSAPTRMRIIDQQPNRGKAEAVRIGMLSSFEAGAQYAGYWDADLATPLGEIERMQKLLETRPACEIVLGSRVALLGRRIKRSALRHYLGRLFATVASVTLGLKVYDTQTGAKLFRNSESALALFAEPFLTTWIFDVEILARFITRRAHLERPGAGAPEQDPIVEMPLLEWTHRAGSKVKPSSFFISFFEMARLYRRYFRHRA